MANCVDLAVFAVLQQHYLFPVQRFSVQCAFVVQDTCVFFPWVFFLTFSRHGMASSTQPCFKLELESRALLSVWDRLPFQWWRAVRTLPLVAFVW